MKSLNFPTPKIMLNRTKQQNKKNIFTKGPKRANINKVIYKVINKLLMLGYLGWKNLFGTRFILLASGTQMIVTVVPKIDTIQQNIAWNLPNEMYYIFSYLLLVITIFSDQKSYKRRIGHSTGPMGMVDIYLQSFCRAESISFVLYYFCLMYLINIFTIIRHLLFTLTNVLCYVSALNRSML